MTDTYDELTSAARPQPATADEIARINWWNSMTEIQRAEALELAGWKPGGTRTPSVAEAWAAYQQRLEALRMAIRPSD